MKKIIVISLVLIMAAGALLAQRADRTNTKKDAPSIRERVNPAQRFMQDLDLSEAQMQKFAEARATFERQNNTINAEIKNLRLDLIEALKAENVRRAKEINQEISSKELQLANAKVDHFANQIKELNREQKQKMLMHIPMMMGSRYQMHNMHENRSMMQKPSSGRRAPGHGDRQRLQDCDDCDDCDGERQYKNRK